MIDFYRTSATEIASKVKTGEWQAIDVATQYLQRIKKTNPSLNAFIYTHNDVLENALKVDEKRKEKIAMSSGLPIENIIAAPDVESIYEVPLVLEKQKLAEKISVNAP